MLTGSEFQTLGAENRKTRDPKDRLWWRTESWWELDERRDLVGSWYCKRSERYGGRPYHCIWCGCILLSRCNHLWNMRKIRCSLSLFSVKNAIIVQLWL